MRLATSNASILIALAGCQPSARPSPPSAPAPTVGAAPATVAPTGVARLLDPAPFGAEELEGERQRVAPLAKRVPKEPTVSTRGAVVVDVDPSRRLLTGHELEHAIFRTEPKAGEPGERVESHRRLLSREPSAELSPAGTVRLDFETVREIPAASLYYGTVVPADPFGFSRHRRRSKKLESSSPLRHSLSFRVPSILAPQYDIANVGSTGRGVAAWRLELLDPSDATARVYDGRLSFRCEPLPCTKEAKFVQLPTARLGPFVDRVGPDRATVSFSTDAATAGVVVARAEGGEIKRFQSSTPGTRHEVELTGLDSKTRYRYYALMVDARGEVGVSRGATFETAPADALSPFSFVVLSDSRSGQGTADERYAGTNRRVLRGLLGAAVAHDPDFVIFVGDLVDGYTTSASAFRFELEAWQRSVAPFAAYFPIYESMGNHEVLLDAWSSGWVVGRSSPTSAEAIFAETFVNPKNGPKPAHAGAPPYSENVYSFDFGNAHFATVNSNYWYRSHAHREDHPAAGRGHREGWVPDDVIEWLDADLAAAKKAGAAHLFVFTHEPGFPNGGHVHDGMWWNGEIPEVLAQRAKLFGVMAEHGVRAIFHGDEHNYSRTLVDATSIPGLPNPLWAVISGGAGAPYYAQSRDVPWLGKVRKFDGRQHFVTVRVHGSEVVAKTIALSGEEIDRFDVTRAE